MKKNLKKILITLIIIICSIVLQLALGKIGLREENLFLVFVIAILFIIIETKNILYGIVSSIIFVLSFNFFHTEPYYTLIVYDGNYYVSFLIFIIVSIIVGSLVTKLQKQYEISKENEKRVRAMYELSSKLLDTYDSGYVYNFVCEYFKNYLGFDFSIVDVKDKIYGLQLNIPVKEISYCLEKNIMVGKDTFIFKDSPYLFFPIKSKMNKFAVLIVHLNDQDISNESIEFIKKNVLHLVVALEREEIIKLQENTKLEVEKEKFKTSILRSLSHDLKTPLTSIQSGSDLILSSYDKIPEEEKKAIIHDIYLEACDLESFVINLLNMTKLDATKKIMNKQKETVDDILSEVYRKVQHKLNHKTLTIKSQDNVVLIDTDATLLIQVFINLIDNAIKHTADNTDIIIDYSISSSAIIFNVIDNGGGIKDNIIDKIFEDFYSLSKKQDRFRSNGLGLSICKAIIEAHGGTIKAFNNDIGGVTFTFSIPFEVN